MPPWASTFDSRIDPIIAGIRQKFSKQASRQGRTRSTSRKLQVWSMSLPVFSQLLDVIFSGEQVLCLLNAGEVLGEQSW
jgi:hypothetical protein